MVGVFIPGKEANVTNQGFEVSGLLIIYQHFTRWEDFSYYVFYYNENTMIFICKLTSRSMA